MAAALLFASCGGSRDGAPTSAARGTGTVSFSAVWQAPPPGASTVVDFPGAPAGGAAARGTVRPMAIDVCDDYGIDWVTMEVWSNGVRVKDGRFECWRHQGTLTEVPAGDNLALRVFATVSGFTTPFWELSGGANFTLSASEAKRFDNIVMSYIGPDGSPPGVVSFGPDNNAQDIPATAAVRFNLSEPMAPGSVTAAGAVLLTDADGASVPGTTVYDNASFTGLFLPSSRLAAGVRHNVALSTSMTDRAGRGLIYPVSWSFIVDEPGGWGPAGYIENAAGGALYPAVAIDAGGNAIAVWYQSDGTRNNIWANRYTPSGGWGTAVLIETDNAGPAQNPAVAMDGSGNAVAVWEQSDGIRSNIWSNRCNASGAWGIAEPIETDNAGPAFSARVAVDNGGNAVAVWTQFDGTRNNIWANRYTTSGGWGTATLVETDNTANAGSPAVAMDNTGNAVAVWEQSDGTRTNILANRCNASGAWGTAEPIETDNAGGAYSPQVAMDGSGNAVAVWQQSDGTRNNILANRCNASGVWGTPAPVETDNAGDAYSPQVAMDAGGNAFAVWAQSDGTRYNIWANRCSASGVWGTAALIETENLGNASSPQLAMDAAGNLWAVWSQLDATRSNIWANRCNASGAWGTARIVASTAGQPAYSPRVALNAGGDGVAVWYQSGPTGYSILASRYVAPGTWGTAAPAESDDTASKQDAQLAADGSGNAVAVWTRWDGVRNHIWANRYTPSGGWGTATPVETDGTVDSQGPRVAMDAGGNAVAVWYQNDGLRNNIWANRYTPSGGWGTAMLIETDNAGDATMPQVAMDRRGNAVAVWHQHDGMRNNIWANRYTPSGGWGTARLIEGDNAGGAQNPQVAMDRGGNAVAVWSQSDGTRYNIWANRCNASGVWGTAVTVETDNAGDAYSPQVAMDGSGIAVAVWSQSDGTRQNVWANRCSPSGVWGTAELLETDNAGHALMQRVAMDGSGNAVAVWRQSDGTRLHVSANRCDASGVWGTAERIETDDAADADWPAVAMDGSGDAVAVWQRYDGADYSVWANRRGASGAWGTARRVETGVGGGATYPQVAMDGSGNAIAVFLVPNQVWCNRTN